MLSERSGNTVTGFITIRECLNRGHKFVFFFRYRYNRRGLEIWSQVRRLAVYSIVVLIFRALMVTTQISNIDVCGYPTNTHTLTTTKTNNCTTHTLMYV